MTIRLLVDGSEIPPDIVNGELLRFPVRLPAQEVRLLSGFARPSDIHGGTDNRALGVRLYGLRWQQGPEIFQVGIDWPVFFDGFYLVRQDPDDGRPFRWTTGNAALPPTAVPAWEGPAWLYANVQTWAGSTETSLPDDPTQVLRAFDNLGRNCEFAIVQRRYGVELPLSLLRWAGTTLDRLVRGLECRFEGIENPATAEVKWADGDYRIYTPYLTMHTYVTEPQDDAGLAEIHRTGCATLRLLRRKLMRDIADAKYIYVFRGEDRPLTHADMRRLHAALRRIGPVSLLCGSLKPAGHHGDDVQDLGDGLYAGYLDKFVIPDGPIEKWLDLCTRVLAMEQRRKAP